jgi:hypothetical protein
MSSPDQRPNVAAHMTLHRYFIQAVICRQRFIEELKAGRGEEPGGWASLMLWYATLYVVVEGWRAERISHAPVTELLRQATMLERLQQCRNAVLHYSPTYLDPRVALLLEEEGFVAWVHSLYDQIGAWFLAEPGGRSHDPA